MNNKNHGHLNWRITGVVLVVLVSLSFTTVTFASPIDDKKKKAAELSNQIESNGDKITALSESYNQTQLKLANLKNDVASAQVEIEAAEAENKAINDRVQKRAVALYTSSSDDNEKQSAPLSSKRKDSYANLINGSDSLAVTQLEISKENLADKKAQLQKQLDSIDAQEKALAAQKKQLETANASQQALLNQTKGELSALIAQQETAKAKAAQAAAQKKTTTKTSTGSNASLPANLPAPSPKAAIAIEFARQQIGKPYVYAAVGPNSYDCSGLTMAAYKAAGISMPHYSGSQYSMFPKVPIDQLEPGDLVFRGAGGSDHVGLYIGNGLMIHAPHTGDVVKIAAVGKIIAYGSRPG